MKLFLNVIFLCLFGFIVSCSSGNSKNSTAPVVETEEPPSTIFFSNVINIIATNCATCHGQPVSNGAPMSLVSYSDISQSANLINIRINLPESDPLSMPRNLPSLSQADKDTIKNWIDAGKPNN